MLHQVLRLAAITTSAVLLLAARSAVAQIIYSENFLGADFAAIGWDGTSAASSGVFSSAGNNVAGEAATPDGDAGTAFHYLNSNGVQVILTTEFAPINPTAGAGVDISWWQTEQAISAGSTIDVHPAVQVGGQWYASQRAFTTTDAQGPWQRNLMTYSAAKANWLTLTPDAGSATLGGAPGVDLSGNITGLGLVTVMSNIQLGYDNAGVLLVNQVGRETVWYDYIEIAAHVIPGDVNGVGGVTIDDYNIIKANYRTNVASRSLGDLNRDGVVTILDFREWKANYPGAVVGASFPIPEPTAAALALSALALLGRTRSARRRAST